MLPSKHRIREAHGYRFIEEGPEASAPPVLLLHGMLGDLSNWSETVDALTAHHFRVVVPVLPVYDLPMKQTSVAGLVEYVHGFTEAMGLDQVALAGNSLGGHVATLYTLTHPERVEALVLSGASGIYEVEMGTSTLRRGDREFIRKRAAMTFYDPEHATDSLVDDVLEIVNNRSRALRLIKMARSVQAETLTDHLARLKVPTLLVWGREDVITPPDVAHEFEERISDAELHFIDQCGHAPMIEHPDRFNAITIEFLQRTIGTPALALSS